MHNHVEIGTDSATALAHESRRRGAVHLGTGSPARRREPLCSRPLPPFRLGAVASQMPFCDVTTVLAAINRLRKYHGTPPLQWSDECAHYAQRCATACQEGGRQQHCFLMTDTTGRRMGQNIYCAMEGVKQDVEGVLEAWYQDVGNYDFQFPGYQLGTGNFTALVWHDTTHVGVAKSQDGRFYAANFWPRGNVVGRANGAKEFEQNVFRPDTELVMRPRNDRESQLFQQFGTLAKGREKIPVIELKRLFQRIGEDRLLQAIQTADLDGDGCVDPWELAIAMVRPLDGDNEPSAVDVMGHVVGFVYYDADCNLGLDRKELGKFLKDRMCRHFSDQEVIDILTRFDTDNNGLLDYKELCKFLDSGYLGSAPNEVGSFTVTKWDDSVEQMMQTVPMDKRRASLQDVKQHVESGFAAKLTKTDDAMVVELARPGGGWRRLSVTLQPE